VTEKELQEVGGDITNCDSLPQMLHLV